MTSRTKAYIYLLIAVAIWGFAGPVIKFTLGTFDPLVFLTYRFFLTSVFLIPVLFLAEPKSFHTLTQLSHSDWLILIVSGLLGTVGQLVLLFYGFSMTTSIDGTLLSSTSPILVAIAGVIFLHEKITRREKLGLTMAFLGTLIVISQTLFESGHLFSGTSLGNILIMAGNFCWVANVIMGKKLLRHHLSPLLQTTISFFLGFIAVSLITITHYSLFQIQYTLLNASTQSHLGVVYMALLSGALAYYLYRKAQKSIEVSEADTFVYLQPLFGTPLAYFWLREPITIPFIVGAIIIAIGVFLVEAKKLPKF